MKLKQLFPIFLLLLFTQRVLPEDFKYTQYQFRNWGGIPRKEGIEGRDIADQGLLVHSVKAETQEYLTPPPLQDWLCLIFYLEQEATLSIEVADNTLNYAMRPEQTQWPKGFHSLLWKSTIYQACKGTSDANLQVRIKEITRGKREGVYIPGLVITQPLKNAQEKVKPTHYWFEWITRGTVHIHFLSIEKTLKEGEVFSYLLEPKDQPEYPLTVELYDPNNPQDKPQKKIYRVDIRKTIQKRNTP